MLPSKIDQMTVFQEIGSETNIGFRHALMTSYLGMRPPKVVFLRFGLSGLQHGLPTTYLLYSR